MGNLFLHSIPKLGVDSYSLIPNVKIVERGAISSKFIEIGIYELTQAIDYVHSVKYGYNSNYDDPLILFKENKGTCTSKHTTIARLAKELNIPLFKNVGIYKMTEEIVTGTQEILNVHHIPYIPMIHCFLVYQQKRFDLTEGNLNGKNRVIDEFIQIKQVPPDFSQKEEYSWYKEVLRSVVLKLDEMKGTKEIEILKARQKGIFLLKSKIV
ncbi:MAG: hypothetical protein RBG13Loki_1489 [Promethearchaeota archaeon CR_4]|nr:MAG: hypothetical protein RBG13Loki_1489 [Candidatus Lokiarchaeota archaeon CR_4]